MILKAPVIVFAYRRADKLKACLNALSVADGHTETDLFIYSDGAKDDNDKKDVETTREVIDRFLSDNGFKNVYIKKRNSNVGLANSIISGVSEVMESFSKVIVVEDDLIVTKDYLTYMNNALDYYEDKQNIWSVTGYTEPLKVLKYYKHDIYYGYRGCSYGWGTWKDRWITVDWEMREYPHFKKNRRLIHKLNRSGNSMIKMLNYQMEGKIDSWAIRWCFAQSMQDRFTVYPKSTFVIDFGTDGSGTHVSKKEINMDNMHIYGKEVRLETLRPDIIITLYYWYMHSDTLWNKIKRIKFLRVIKKKIFGHKGIVK